MKNKFKQTLCLSFAFLLGAFQAFGLTMKGQVILTGNFAEKTQKKDEDAKYEFFKLNEKPQKDDDGLIIEFSDGSFGGRLALWYAVNASINKDNPRNYGNDGSKLSFRRSNLWFKPSTSLKLTVGYVGNDQLYKEKIDDWKVGNPFSYRQRDWVAHPGYINNSDVDEMGLGFESRAVEGLILTGAIARKWGTPGAYESFAFWSKDGNGDPVYGAWGLTARYYPGNDICFQAAFRDNGSEDWKVARCAIGYEGNGFYAFAQPCFGIDWNKDESKYQLSGICFDLYGEYRYDAWTFIAHVPLTVRLTDWDEDPSYMEYILQVKYNLGRVGNMDDFSPNIKFGSQNHDGDKKEAFIRFDNVSDTMNFDITPGIQFKVASCEVKVGFEMLFHSKYYTDINSSSDFEWRVPFSAKIKF